MNAQSSLNSTFREKQIDLAADFPIKTDEVLFIPHGNVMVKNQVQDFVGATEAWRRAMEGQHQFWEKNQAREQEFILKRDVYRTLLVAQAAVPAAQNAVASLR